VQLFRRPLESNLPPPRVHSAGFFIDSRSEPQQAKLSASMLWRPVRPMRTRFKPPGPIHAQRLDSSRPMKPEQSLRTFLKANPGRRFCVHCLARTLGFAHTGYVRVATWRVARDPMFQKKRGRCENCNASRAQWLVGYLCLKAEGVEDHQEA
jgi:hypothetical protein